MYVGLLAWAPGSPEGPRRAAQVRARSAVPAMQMPAPVAIVTGGSGGIGLAVCHRLAARGLNIVIAYGHNEERAAKACEELSTAHGISVASVRGDLTTETGRNEAVNAIFTEVDALGGKVSAFVHAAGYFASDLLSHHFDGACSDFEMCASNKREPRPPRRHANYIHVSALWY